MHYKHLSFSPLNQGLSVYPLKKKILNLRKVGHWFQKPSYVLAESLRHTFLFE